MRPTPPRPPSPDFSTPRPGRPPRPSTPPNAWRARQIQRLPGLILEEEEGLWVPTREESRRHSVLDPKNDAVFKALFGAAERSHLLVGVLNAVFAPAAPFTGVEALTREYEVAPPDGKCVRLDVVATMSDGTQVFVEMQLRPSLDLPDRVTFYWASLHAESLVRGQSFAEGAATFALLILGRSRFPECGVHEVFRIRGDRSGRVLTEKFRVDVLQLDAADLDKGEATRQDPVTKLARFFRAESLEALETLGTESPLMAHLTKELLTLSAQADLRDYARVAHARQWFEERERRRAVEESRSEGRLEGQLEGRREGQLEGKLEGRLEGKLELAARLLARGDSRESVEALLGFSLAEYGV